jgi:choline kinase
MGTRVRLISPHFNKALLPINNKAVISYIIEKVSHKHDIVIAIGYGGEIVEEYCKIAHPEYNFHFVHIKNYETNGPSYSLDACKKLLQKPFYLATADTIVTESFPQIETNWIGIYHTAIPELYATVQIDKNNNVINLINKNPSSKYDNAFIGIAGIYDYKIFWKELDVKSNEIVSAFYNTKNYKKLIAYKFTWYDTGAIDGYEKTIKELNKEVSRSPKPTEGFFNVNNKIIKVFIDDKISQNRIKRCKQLKGLVPKLNLCSKYTYSYKYQDGKTLYHYNNNIWNKFIKFAFDNLWHTKYIINGNDEYCDKFYFNKTHIRTQQLLENRPTHFSETHIINGIATESIQNLLKKIDWKLLNKGMFSTKYHGDLQFDNIIYSDNNEKFILIDWRQDFGGCIDYGDIYYDMAKLYGGCLMPYYLLYDDNNISIKYNKQNIDYTFIQNSSLLIFAKKYLNILENKKFDIRKIQLLTGLIYLNMAPLHLNNFGNMLFFHAKYMLQKFINE